MMPGIHKLRYLISTRSELLIRVCLAVTLVSVLGAGFTFLNPPITEATITTESSPIATTLTSQATVTQDSHLYARGDTLSEMPVYPRKTAPTVLVSAQTTPPQDPDLQLDQRTMLVYEAQTASGETFWQETQPLQRTRASAADGTIVSNATVNISALDTRLAQLETEVGDAGHVRVYVAVKTAYSSPQHAGTLQDRGEIRIRQNSYEIEHLTLRDELTITEQQRHPVAAKVVQLPLPLLGVTVIPHTTLVFALLGVVGASTTMIAVRYADVFDPNDEQASLQKARYAEWISTGTLPPMSANQTVQMESLEDLVDVALDSKKRIIHDATKGTYGIFDSPIVYVYQEEVKSTDETRDFEFPTQSSSGDQ